MISGFVSGAKEKRIEVCEKNFVGGEGGGLAFRLPIFHHSSVTHPLFRPPNYLSTLPTPLPPLKLPSHPLQSHSYLFYEPSCGVCMLNVPYSFIKKKKIVEILRSVGCVCVREEEEGGKRREEEGEGWTGGGGGRRRRRRRRSGSEE